MSHELGSAGEGWWFQLTPLKKMTFTIDGKIRFMFQTTNQYVYIYIYVYNYMCI